MTLFFTLAGIASQSLCSFLVSLKILLNIPFVTAPTDAPGDRAPMWHSQFCRFPMRRLTLLQHNFIPSPILVLEKTF